MEGMPLKYLPSFIFTTDPNDVVVNFAMREIDRAVTKKPAAILLNTFDELEQDVLAHLSTVFPPIYTIGPLCALTNHFPSTKHEPLASIGSNLWTDEPECLKWLDAHAPGSVVFVNFGSVTVMSPGQLVEFAWGLANTKVPFLWIIRPDIVRGETAILPPEFVEETAARGMMAGWCPQEEVLKHPAVGGFLSHMGWNSFLESVCGGVPVVCWPFFAEQQINTWFACEKWGVGREIGNDVRREQVEEMVRELMVGEEMRRKAAEWRRKAEEAVAPASGLSYVNFERLVEELI
ncbi:unnamed protein product [Linum tenue]|uniref:UDP-glycosyltransferase 1 n=3 Tax=Linum tenue TaxID=586396 RepID=A0AAV0H729_9ROSI|nr:unnamed protein product [Linum tenue]